jgi:uncharacterized protein (TIGR00299 family) protein
MRVAYLDCFSGISGDMTLGAFLDAGLRLDALRDHLALVDLVGYSLHTQPVTQSGIVGTRLSVDVERPLDHDHRHWSDIRGMLEASRLPDPMRRDALRIFATLAEAEGAVHGIPPDEVHFHEVGAIDSIVDIVGAAVAVHLLGIERLYSAPLPLGHGFVDCRHGRLPLPAPATLEVIARTGAATRPVDIDKELVTPTGAAIAGTLATFAQPAMQIASVGYGYGTTELPWPNALRLWLGELSAPAPVPVEQPDRGDEVLMETNIDDMPAEIFGYVMERLFAAGALDVFFTPITMKKNRPATQISIIAPADRRADLEQILLTETTTFGIRALPIVRTKSERSHERVETPYGPVRRKRKEWQGRLLDAIPEYDDCAELARRHNVPFRLVYEAARRA